MLAFSNRSSKISNLRRCLIGNLWKLRARHWMKPSPFKRNSSYEIRIAQQEHYYRTKFPSVIKEKVYQLTQLNSTSKDRRDKALEPSLLPELPSNLKERQTII